MKLQLTAARELHQNPDQDTSIWHELQFTLGNTFLFGSGGLTSNLRLMHKRNQFHQFLLSFIEMILCGPSLEWISEAEDRKSAALSIPQLLIYNAVKNPQATKCFVATN